MLLPFVDFSSPGIWFKGIAPKLVTPLGDLNPFLLSILSKSDLSLLISNCRSGT